MKISKWLLTCITELLLIYTSTLIFQLSIILWEKLFPLIVILNLLSKTSLDACPVVN